MSSNPENQLLKKFTAAGIDAFWTASNSHITYFTQYLSRESSLLISPKGNIFFTDSRYRAEARIALKNRATVTTVDGSFYALFADTCVRQRFKKVGFEERYLTVAAYKNLKKELAARSIRIVPTEGLVEGLRLIKQPGEIKILRKALEITIDSFKFAKKIVSPGKKENEVAAELQRYLTLKGARGCAFDTIVASGENSAFPHHLTSQRRIHNNEVVLIDMGIDYQGYKSDLTRVFFLGRIEVLIKKAYAAVLKARQEALKIVSPGIPIRDIDRVGRACISEDGFGHFFIHSIGHGVGLDVHEQPKVWDKAEGVLKSGMVVTIEPGIYLPGKFGIRIEDMVLVTKKGCEVLSGSLNQ